MKLSLILLMLFCGLSEIVFADDSLYSLDGYLKYLSEHNQFGTQQKMTEPSVAYTAIAAGNSSIPQKAIGELPPEVMKSFFLWTGRIVRPNLIPKGLERKTVAMPDVSVFSTTDRRGNRIFEWVSDILVYEHSGEVPYCILETGSSFIFLAKKQDYAALSSAEIREQSIKMLVTFFNLSEQDLSRGELSIRKNGRSWYGQFRIPGAKVEQWKDVLDFVIGRDFALFCFLEIVPNRMPPPNPGDVNRF